MLRRSQVCSALRRLRLLGLALRATAAQRWAFWTIFAQFVGPCRWAKKKGSR
ncbi:hypothetical protein SGRA_2130 [Saprospira grandis str. Lewin]|uniref:Uncharacterized protein n=1 Tax=Saprospira grandis (strain Lewin) TaxID=984262 RepID=H6L334_SAPGL|nr:hypothetical protein SGRA_2130 [Saprospira grandis str. Lewin]